MSKDTEEEITGKFVHETPKAICLIPEDWFEELWVPLSVCSHISRDGKGSITLTVAAWFYRKEME